MPHNTWQDMMVLKGLSINNSMCGTFQVILGCNSRMAEETGQILQLIDRLQMAARALSLLLYLSLIPLHLHIVKELLLILPPRLELWNEPKKIIRGQGEFKAFVIESF